MSSAVTYQAYEDLYAHPEVVEQVQELLSQVRERDDVAALGEAFVRAIVEDHGHRHIVAVDAQHGGDSPIVGVLGVDPSRTVELAVSPSRRHHGIGRGLLEHAVEDLDLHGAIDVWAHGDGPSAQKLVEAVGGRRTRELLKMAANCEPGSLRREEFMKGDEEARKKAADQDVEVMTYVEAVEKFGEEFVDQEWVRVNNEAFAWHPEQGGWDVPRLVNARETDWFRPEGVWMLWAKDEITEEPRCLGFHWTKLPMEEREKPEGERAGEVYVVCLADEARGRGLGSVITLIGVGSLLEQGAGVIELYVEGDNAPAVATYRGLDFEVVHTDVVYRGELN